MLVLDSGGLSLLARRDVHSAALMIRLRQRGLWPPVLPMVVLVESLTGTERDANTNRLVKACDVDTTLSVRTARRAAELRARSRRGSAVDAVVVATAEPGGTVLTSDDEDLRAPAAHAVGVEIVVV
ncbi:MAG TPA: PIN domain-containing protein [Marmoricola sp.]|jgi:predicted nucleic acid-binding protein|nr:PIN domain-containing protein [Marmoricola sp.]